MCYYPNILEYKENSVLKKDGNMGIKRIKIIFSNDPNFKGYEYYLNLDEINKNKPTYGEKIRYKLIPCGKCDACRKKQTYDWSMRIELESKQYEHNYFITLTYNDENIYIPDYTFSKETGEIFINDGSWQGSLKKEDGITFIKSLRKYFSRDYNHKGLKFYMCGEYGEIGERPHMHAILMNCPKLQLKPIGQSKTKNIYFTNERIEQIWNKGYITIGEANWDSITYTAGYCQKKLFGNIGQEIYARKGQIPVFANMSRRPGIGRTYYEENKNKIYEFDEIINSKGNPIRPPSYFDRLMDIGEHDVMENIKEIRDRNSKNRLQNKLQNTTLTLKEQLEVEARAAKEKQKHYQRNRRIKCINSM